METEKDPLDLDLKSLLGRHLTALVFKSMRGEVETVKSALSL